MLIAGGDDARVPDDHAKHMRAELRDRGVEPEWVYDATEKGTVFIERNTSPNYSKNC